jgi:hypothetical protein
MSAGNLILSLIVKHEFQLLHLSYIGQNIFLTIAIGVSIVACLEWIKKLKDLRKLIPLALIYFLSIAAIFVEYSIFGLVMFYIFYFFRGNKYLFVVYSIPPLLILGWQYLTYQGDFWLYDYRWLTLAAIPFLLLYNGERGPSIKYFFYLIYPVHIWLFYYLSYVFLVK